jgi:hypothetical protein
MLVEGCHHSVGNKLCTHHLVVLINRPHRVLETVDQAFIGHLAYYYSISNYARPQVLLKADTTWYVFLPSLKDSGD